MNLRESASSILSTYGFVCHGSTWNRQAGDAVQVIQLQNDTKAGYPPKVTINLGLCNPQVWQIVWDKDPPPTYDETDCCPRFRIGFLLANEDSRFVDTWWSLSEGDEAVVTELVNVIGEKCVPFLIQNSELRQMKCIANALSKRMAVLDRLYFAALCHVSGDEGKRNEILTSLLSLRTQSWQETIEAVVQRMKLPLAALKN